MMMKMNIKYILCVPSLLVAVAMFSPPSRQLPAGPGRADVFIRAMDQDGRNGRPRQTENPDFYDMCERDAETREQKDAIASLRKDGSNGVGVWQREALTIVGRIPKDQKRLSKDEAKRIIEESAHCSDVLRAFEAVAGAPDFVGGSGIHRIIYYVDDSKRDAIYCMNGLFIYVSYDDEGNQVTTPLNGNDKSEPDASDASVSPRAQ